MSKRQWMLLSMVGMCFIWIPLLFIPLPHGKSNPKTLLKALPAPYSSGDPAHGNRVFQACAACHATTSHAQKMAGPNLYGLFGRRAGTGPGFDYSPAMKAAGYDWDAPRLDRYLAAPDEVMPGTRMVVRGLVDHQSRIDLIAYLRLATAEP